jgi:steroid delta-isomerase-like uncharacterized protein
MSINDPKHLISKYIEDVWNKADLGVLENLTNGTFTYHLGGQPPRDISAMRKFLQDVHMAFPDWRVEIQDIVVEDNLVAVRWSGKATHNGIFHGVPPTGEQISVCGMNMYRIENGKISLEWEQMDSLGMLQQLGILPVQTS